MLNNKPKQLSLYSILYNKIPENHILKLINNAVNFSFINKMLENSYCKYYGRPAKEPEMMIKILVLQYLYNLSDVKVIEETSLNLSYMWFVGINPEEDLPDPSLLTKFRKQRLQEMTMDDIITEIVKQCVEKGIIKDTSISIDATHTEANTKRLMPERLMKHLAKKIFKDLKEENNDELLEKLNTNIPKYKEIDDHIEAKKVMKNYLKQVIIEVEENLENIEESKVYETIEKSKEILQDPKFIEQRSTRSLVDKDARVGRKSKTEHFFGYKTEFTMLASDKIITAAKVEPGNYTDGTNLKELLDRNDKIGIETNQFLGDKAYFRKSILEEIEQRNIEAIIPPSRAVYKIDDSRFTYNKDSDEWICERGCCTKNKVKIKRKDKKGYYYKFSKEDCMNCPNRESCYKGKTKFNKITITENTQSYYEYSLKSKSEEFKEKYKKRAQIEPKNAELKRFHGMAKARGFGLESMRTQVKLTILAVNLKRIAKLFSLKRTNIYMNFRKIILVCPKFI